MFSSWTCCCCRHFLCIVTFRYLSVIHLTQKLIIGNRCLGNVYSKWNRLTAFCFLWQSQSADWKNRRGFLAIAFDIRGNFGHFKYGFEYKRLKASIRLGRWLPFLLIACVVHRISQIECMSVVDVSHHSAHRMRMFTFTNFTFAHSLITKVILLLSK